MDGSKFGFQGYPFYLSKVMEENGITDYELVNFGLSSQTAMNHEDKATLERFSYGTTCDFKRLLESKPDIIVLQLTTNDLLWYGWSEKVKQQIKDGYLAIANKMLSLSPKPKLYLSIAPPMTKICILKGMEHAWSETQSDRVNNIAPGLVREIAK